MEPTPRHREYIEYYRARVRRYEGSELYPSSARSEGALLAALEEAEDLESFQAAVQGGELALDNAKALVRDQEGARAKLYEECEEPVRASGPKEILAALEGAGTVTDLNSLASRAHTAAGEAVNLDAHTDFFHREFARLENMDVWKTAPVPERWRAELDGWASEAAADGAAVWRDTVLPSARRLDPSWAFEESAVWEMRHRRRIPFPDAVLRRRLEQHRRLRGS